MAATLILIAVVAMLGSILKILKEIRVIQASRNELLLATYKECDCEYPAFSRAEIHCQHANIEMYKSHAEEAEAKVTEHPDFASKGPDFAPSGQFEDLLRDAVYYAWKQRRTQIRYELMIEANLAVRRGEKIIAEARRADEQLPDVGLVFGWSGCIVDNIQDWKERLRRGAGEPDNRPPDLYDSGRVNEFEDALKQQFEQWQDRRQACEGWRLYKRSWLQSRTVGLAVTSFSQPTA